MTDNNAQAWGQPTEATKTNDQLIGEWEAAAKQLAHFKALEATARKAMVDRMFPNNAGLSGTKNADLANGYKLKAVFKLNYSLNNKDDAVDKALSKIEKTGPEGQFVANRLVKWKPELSVSEYNELEPKFKKIIDEVLKISDGTPSVEIVAPKEKR